MAQLILGAPIAAGIESDVTREAAALAGVGVRPRLCAVRCAVDAASDLYVKRQRDAASRLGLEYETCDLPADASEREFVAAISALNARPDVTGIIVQMPPPAGVSAAVVQAAIAPAKDVEAVTPASLGRLLDPDPPLTPCTPAAVIECLRATGVPTKGLDAVVIGRSRIVGRPAALMLVDRDLTVTVCHRSTRDLASTVRRADVIVLAAGRAGALTPEMTKRGAIVIDVGINRVERDGKKAVVGDADPAIAEVAGWLTPVPGGVGPVTVAQLWRNVVRAARLQSNG